MDRIICLIHGSRDYVGYIGITEMKWKPLLYSTHVSCTEPLRLRGPGLAYLGATDMSYSLNSLEDYMGDYYRGF